MRPKTFGFTPTSALKTSINRRSLSPASRASLLTMVLEVSASNRINANDTAGWCSNGRSKRERSALCRIRNRSSGSRAWSNWSRILPAAAPQTSLRSMCVSANLSAANPRNGNAPPGLKCTPNHRSFRGIGNEETFIGSGHNCSGKPGVCVATGPFVNSQLVVHKVENNLKCAGRENTLSQIRRGIATVEPEILDESREWWTRAARADLLLLLP